MKRLLTSAAAAAVLVAGTGSGAQAQMMEPAPLFTVGVYGGAQYTSGWFEIADEGYRPGFGSIFGATTTFFTSPNFGVRLNGSYFPSGAPQPNDDSFGDTDYALSNYLADLSLVFRAPFTLGGLLTAPYMFVGGGAMWTDVAGDGPRQDAVDCLPEYTRRGPVCLSYEPGYASVGQGTVGIGFDVMSLGGLGLYGEVATHGYDSPAHVFTDNDAVAEDRFAFTTRATLGLKLGLGSLAPAVVPVPPVAPPPPPPPPPAPPAAPVENAIRVCVVQGTTLTDVDAVYRPSTGDTLVMVQGQRRPFAQAYPAVSPTYAAGATWFINNDAVRFNNREFVKYGVPRVISPAELRHVGDHQGVGLWAQTGATAPYDVVYVPIRPGCEFQAYQARTTLTPRG